MDECGSFAHAAQAIVSSKTIARENRRIHALSVVARAQSELLTVITTFNFDLLCLGVMEGVAQRFSSDFVDLVTEDGMEISRLALNRYAECHWLTVGRVGLEFFSEGAYSQREIVTLDCGSA